MSAKMRAAVLLGAVTVLLQAAGGAGAGSAAQMTTTSLGGKSSSTLSPEALDQSALELRAFPQELLDAAQHPMGRKAVVAWLLFREVGEVYVPCFGLCADYLALFARPLTRRATAGWARQAAYRKPPSRKEQKAANQRRKEQATWAELGLDRAEVAAFLATPYDPLVLVTPRFVAWHNLGARQTGGGSIRRRVLNSSAAAAAAAATASDADGQTSEDGDESSDTTDGGIGGSGWGAVGQSKRGKQGFKVSFNLGGSTRKTAPGNGGATNAGGSFEEVTGRSAATMPALPASKTVDSTKLKGTSSSSSGYVLGHVDLSRKFKRMLGGTKTSHKSRRNQGSKTDSSRRDYSDAASEDAISGLALGSNDFESDDEDSELESYRTKTKERKLKDSKSRSSSSNVKKKLAVDVATTDDVDDEDSDQSDDPLDALVLRRKTAAASSSTTNSSSTSARRGAKIARSTPLHSKPSKAEPASKTSTVTAQPVVIEKAATSSSLSTTKDVVFPEPTVAAKTAEKVSSSQPTVPEEKAKNLSPLEPSNFFKKTEKVAPSEPVMKAKKTDKEKTALPESVTKVKETKKVAPSEPTIATEKVKKVVTPEPVVKAEQVENIGSPEAIKSAEVAERIVTTKPADVVKETNKGSAREPADVVKEAKVIAQSDTVTVSIDAKSVPSAVPVVAAFEATKVSLPGPQEARTPPLEAVVLGRSAPSPTVHTNPAAIFPAIPRPTSLTSPAEKLSEVRDATPVETSTKSPAETTTKKSGAMPIGTEKESNSAKATDRIKSKGTQTAIVKNGGCLDVPTTKSMKAAPVKSKRKKRAGVQKVATTQKVVTPTRADNTELKAPLTAPSPSAAGKNPTGMTIDTRLFSTDRMAQKIVPKPSTQKSAARKKSKENEASTLGDSKVGTPFKQKKSLATGKVNVESAPKPADQSEAKPTKKAAAVKRTAATTTKPVATKSSTAPVSSRVSPLNVSSKPKPVKIEPKERSQNSQAAKELAAKLSERKAKKSTKSTQSNKDLSEP